MTTDEATFGMPLISLDTITHANLGMLFITIAIAPMFYKLQTSNSATYFRVKPKRILVGGDVGSTIKIIS